MIDPNMELLSTVVIATLETLSKDPEDSSAWAELRSAHKATQKDDPDLSKAIEDGDAQALAALVEEWHNGKRHLPACDRGVLKRALKAYRKSLKVTRLDAESKLGGGPFSAGSESRIVGIQPPPRYPMPVWMELVRQGRLLLDRAGTFELPPEG